MSMYRVLWSVVIRVREHGAQSLCQVCGRGIRGANLLGCLAGMKRCTFRCAALPSSTVVLKDLRLLCSCL
jgi:hypothetical protein